ncbi:MAG: Asp-tRNA(Asn)/Glu-tRNA(Gln) amidotransferase subunit GatB [Holosporaceae bacterium]|nr:Asp-tRNA(Asn)/Glu-tRNA(Gln) amidotransferase subunit GatB [Holosporaceae bacterium]
MRYIETTSGQWEVVIGLEVHAQIISKSKLFSNASTRFGVNPNENVTFLDAALPGTLPAINSFCIDQAIKTGLGLNGTVNLISYFDRKNYFYADLPHGYQITQFYHPLISGGYIETETEDGVKRININHIHIEQDAGKSIHDQSPAKSFIDLNRAGVALIEIVTEPDMRSAEDAANFLRALRSILRYLRTCDGNMDEGSMRADVNVSVHRPETEYGTRAEVKNINSIRFIVAAINFEVNRQVELLESGRKVIQETRLFDSATGKTKSMRYKEDAHDYRYFQEPDLPPLILDPVRIEALRETIPELPSEKTRRLQRDYGLPRDDAVLIACEEEVADFFEKALASVEFNKALAKILSNWITVELFALLNKYSKTIAVSRISPKDMGELVSLIKTDVISGKIAKDVLALMWTEQKSPSAIVKEMGWTQITSVETIRNSLKEVLEDHADKVTEYKSGKEKLFGFFIGQAMKKTMGKANPQVLNDVLRELLSE